MINFQYFEWLSSISTQVASYDPPAILFLANGAYTYECLNSTFRVDPKSEESDFPNFDPEDKGSRIQESCNETALSFSISLDQIGEYEEVLNKMPDWLQKNLITTVTGTGVCDTLKRAKKDASDDLER